MCLFYQLLKFFFYVYNAKIIEKRKLEILFFFCWTHQFFAIWLHSHGVFMFSKHSTKTKGRINWRATHMRFQIGRFLRSIYADRNFTGRGAKLLIETSVRPDPHVFFSDFHLDDISFQSKCQFENR